MSPAIYEILIFSIPYFIISAGYNSAGYKNPNFAPGRSTIVHLFEWKWDDIAAECERFLQHKGYGGVQISPPNENLIIPKRPWWERYQPVSYALKTRSGDENSFKNMTTRCNAVGVRIYVDAIINHMSASDGNGTAGNEAKSSELYFPGIPYTNKDFHQECETGNSPDKWVDRNCKLSGLKDLDQGSDYVRTKVIEFMNHLIDLGVAGFRVDAARHMWPNDLEYIYSHLKNLNIEYGFAENARPFIYQEVSNMDNEYIRLGTMVEFKYSRSIGNVFRGNDKLKWLRNWGPEWGLIDGLDAVAFVDNHDNQRDKSGSFLTYKNAKQYKMATAFMLAHPYGTTRIMSSYDFQDFNQGPPHDKQENILSPGINPDNTCTNGWICEHRWREIYNMVGFRNVVTGTPIKNWWSNDDQQIAFCRGDKGFVSFTNWGDINQDLQTCLPAGIYCDIISGGLENGACTGKVVEVRSDGVARIVLSGLEFNGVLAIHVGSKKK